MVRVFPDARGALTPTYWIEGQSRDLCPLRFDLHLIISRGGFFGIFLSFSSLLVVVQSVISLLILIFMEGLKVFAADPRG
jgi:lipoprotein signal peptidase